MDNGNKIRKEDIIFPPQPLSFSSEPSPLVGSLPQKASLSTNTEAATTTAPKKNLTSYVLFSNHIRPVIKKRNPGISFAELSKQMGLEYRNLTPEQREYWDIKAKDDKMRYDIELDEYRKKLNDYNADTAFKAKKGKSSYNLYFQAMNDTVKAENPGLTFGELSKKLAQDFKSLSEEERRQWDELAKMDRKRCREEPQHTLIKLEANYNESYSSHPSFLQEIDTTNLLDKPSSTSTNVISQKLNSKKQRNKDPNIPKKNVTAYIHFCNEKRKELKQLHPTANICELGKILGLEYKKISESERKKYDEMAREDKERYDEEMEKYQAQIDIEKEEIDLLSMFRARPS